MATIEATEVDWNALTAEAVKHLQALIQCNTVNPPGNEGPAITYIREQLAAEDIDAHTLEPTPGRPSLWARLPGNGSKCPLLLLSHVDVVPAEAEHWTADPFGGEIRNGYIFGRGAVDMKGMTAKQLTLLLHLARSAKETGHRLSRDLVLLAVADEEREGTHGMAWIAEHEPALLDAEYALNEGGGFALDMRGKRIYVCETAQKGRALVTVRAEGSPGHGAVPHSQNAIIRLARAITRIGASSLPLHVTPTMRQFVMALATTHPQPQRSLLLQMLNPLLSDSMLRAFPDKHVANALRAMLHNTATPTVVQGGTAINVLPSEAIARLDGRIIPGQTGEVFTSELRKRMSDPHVTVEVELLSSGHEGRADTALFAAISKAITRYDPGAIVAPYLLPTFTDSRFLVPKGVYAYGFDPMQPEPGWPSPQHMAHGHDERISIANIGFGLRVLYDAIVQVASS